MRGPIIEHIFYEIAMSIGNSLNLEEMLRTGLTTYLRKLNCLAGAVYELQKNAPGTLYHKVYAIPRMPGHNRAMEGALAQIPISAEANDKFLRQLPLTGSDGEYAYHIMDLPGYGLLILVRSGQIFEGPVLKSLLPINAKLARACISCRQTDQLEIMNTRLQEEMAIRRTAEENYRGIFENSAEGIFQSSLDGRPLRVNQSMASMLGYETPEEAIAAVDDFSTKLYANPSDRITMLDDLMNEGTVRSRDTLVKKKDGSLTWLSLSATLVRTIDGEPSHVEGVAEDISERKRIEEALTEALSEAEQHSRLKSNFISMVSHELRTPLTSIYGFARMLQKRLDDTVIHMARTDQELAVIDRMRDNADIITREGQRLTELINHVLDLSRLESGKFEWNTEAVSLSTVLRHSPAATDVLFQSKGLELITDIDMDVPLVEGDHDRLVQVCINLLSNAAKFTEEGRVRCSLSYDTREVRVCVTDTGIGVPESEREAIFDVFKQLGDTLTDKPKGSGLGLPISREIIEHYGGRIWVEGERGATFCFVLPRLVD